jgi:putative membrane protein insertion efficiency factor
VVRIRPRKAFDEKTAQASKRTGCNQELRFSSKSVLDRVVWLVGHLVILAVRIYQNTLRLALPPSCRFHPSCSEYAAQAFKRFGVIKGGWLSVKRICRCHPFNPGGFDPVS